MGNWQLQRAEWKNNIITQLESEYAKNPMDYRLEFSDLQNLDIQQGHIRGQFDYSKQMLFGPKKLNETIGYDVIIPMNLKNGTVLVNMGWVKGENRKEIKTTSPRGNIMLTGISRKPDWNKFTPNNSPENDIWTKFDINEIAKAKEIKKIAPVIFYTKSAPLEFKALKMLEENWLTRNKHMQYAIFWFSMAGILLILVSIYFLKQRKQHA